MNIKHGNFLTDELFDNAFDIVIGNPPYRGSKYQTEQQKEEMGYVFHGFKNYKKLDYSTAFFIRTIKSYKVGIISFITTKSICQGEQVCLLWPFILDNNYKIFFAKKPFTWESDANVTVIIVGISSISKPKRNINPYLAEGENLIIYPKNNPISNFPMLNLGNMPKDGGYLLLNKQEKDEILFWHPEAEKFIKRFMGSNEFIKGIERYCLWVEDKEVEEALSFSLIRQRMDKVRSYREKSKAPSTQKYSNYPHRFVHLSARAKNNALIIPRVSSERREFLPTCFISSNVIISDLSYAIYDPELYIFGVIASKMHMAWVKAVGCRMKTDISYSSTLCYNNFPFPEITEQQKQNIKECVLDVLNEREKHPGKTIAELYDPGKMPEGLRRSHQDMDTAIENCYRPGQPFKDDEERLAYLFDLYKKMI